MKKSKLLIAPLLVVPFIASCGGGSEEYKVSIPDTNGVIVTPNKATKGKEYVGTIKMAQDVDPDHILPDALDKVTSGNKELAATKDYTYTLKEDKLSADFKIPAANIVGDVSIQLTLKDKPDPTTQHTLTFTGHDCELYLDSGYKTKFVDGKYDEGPFNGYIKPSDGFDFPTDANVELTSGGEDYDTYEYDDQTGAISFTVDADIDIEATAIDYTVTKEEFDKAFGLEDVTYLQMGSYGGVPDLFTSDVIDKYSPNIYYFKSIVTTQAGENYTEKYVYKINDSVYKSISRGSSTEPWGNWVDDTAASFKTPDIVGQNMLDMLDTLGFEFDPTKFNVETKTYVIPVDDGAGGTVDLIFRFENKKIIYFDLGGQGEYTFSYDEVTPELPIPAPTL